MMATSNNTPANDDFHKLLLVVRDLAQQLDENKQATTKLKLHADLLKVLLLASIAAIFGVRLIPSRSNCGCTNLWIRTSTHLVCHPQVSSLMCAWLNY